jgi:hypothetical protein
VLWFGPEILGSRVRSADLSVADYQIRYSGPHLLRLDTWPAGSSIGRNFLRYYSRYPRLTVNGVTAYGRHDLVFRTRGSVARVTATWPPLTAAERRTLLGALRVVRLRP